MKQKPLQKLVNSNRKDQEGKPIFLQAPPLSEETFLAYVRRHPAGVLFIHVQRYFLDSGDRALYGDSTKVLWNGMSQEFAEIVVELLDSRKIYCKTCDPVAYWNNHAFMPLPVAKQPNRKYKKEHWLPVLLVAREGEESGCI